MTGRWPTIRDVNEASLMTRSKDTATCLLGHARMAMFRETAVAADHCLRVRRIEDRQRAVLLALASITAAIRGA